MHEPTPTGCTKCRPQVARTLTDVLHEAALAGCASRRLHVARTVGGRLAANRTKASIDLRSLSVQSLSSRSYFVAARVYATFAPSSIVYCAWQHKVSDFKRGFGLPFLVFSFALPVSLESPPFWRVEERRRGWRGFLHFDFEPMGRQGGAKRQHILTTGEIPVGTHCCSPGMCYICR